MQKVTMWNSTDPKVMEARKTVEGIDQGLGVVLSKWYRQPTVRLIWPQYQDLLYLKGLDPLRFTEAVCRDLPPIKEYRGFRLSLVDEDRSTVMGLNSQHWPERVDLVLTGNPVTYIEYSRGGEYPKWR